MGSTPPTVRSALSVLAVATVVMAGTACGGSATDADTIGRDAFVATYVELRMAALDTDSQRVAEADRAEILARHGVTGDQLLLFVETHATDLDYMRDVWNEVELSLDRTPSAN